MPDLDDDQHWLDLMAGRTAPEADARTRREASWLRAALLSYRVTAPAGAPAHADDRVARLLTRARDAGVLASAANEPFAFRAWRPALAACIAVAAVALVFIQPGQVSVPHGTGAPTLRGATTQRIEAPDPLQRRQQVLQTLRDAGLEAQPFKRLGRPGIDVALPVPLPAAQVAVLSGLGLVPPPGPSLQIEFVTPAPRP